METEYQNKLVKLKGNEIILIDRPYNYYQFTQEEYYELRDKYIKIEKENIELNLENNKLKNKNLNQEEIIRNQKTQITDMNLTIQELEQKLKEIQIKNDHQPNNKKSEFEQIINQIVNKYQIVYQEIENFKQKYKNMGSIDNGNYGKVDKIELQQYDENLSNLNTKFAVKILKCPSQEDLKKQEREVLALQQVNLLPDQLRKYVIKLYEQYWDPEEDEILIVIPRAQTSFYNQILKNKKKNTFYQASDLCYKLSCALLGLSTLDILEIIHRDVKPQNMLIMEDGSLVLADFGTAKQYKNDKNSVIAGTPTYFSLEMLRIFSEQTSEEYYNQNIYNILKNNDLYGIGKAFIFAASLIESPKYPLIANDYKGYKVMIEDYYKKAFQTIESKQILSPQFIELLKGMVNPEYKERYNLQTCLNKISQLPDW